MPLNAFSPNSAGGSRSVAALKLVVSGFARRLKESFVAGVEAKWAGALGGDFETIVLKYVVEIFFEFREIL